MFFLPFPYRFPFGSQGLGYIWTYGAAIVIAYPFGITNYLIWRYIKKDGKKRNKIIPPIIIAGLLLSLIALWLTR